MLPMLFGGTGNVCVCVILTINNFYLKISVKIAQKSAFKVIVIQYGTIIIKQLELVIKLRIIYILNTAGSDSQFLLKLLYNSTIEIILIMLDNFYAKNRIL